MIWDPLELLDVAKVIGSSSEGHCRTSISRAYYALFLRARDDLADKALMTKSGTGRDHGEVVRVLWRQRRAGAARRLNSLRESREKADYDTGNSVSEGDAEKALRLADEIKGLLAPDWGVTT